LAVLWLDKLGVPGDILYALWQLTPRRFINASDWNADTIRQCIGDTYADTQAGETTWTLKYCNPLNLAKLYAVPFEQIGDLFGQRLR
jgi:hypothetical protein